MNIKYYLLLLAIIFVSNSYAAPALTLCIDGDCKTSQRVSLSDEDWSKINEVFSQPAQTAQQERDFIAKALARIEKATLTALATKSVKSFSAQDLHDRMNNRDQALNYKSYMSLLLDQKLIHHHVLRKIEHRSSWVGMNEYAVVILDQLNGGLYSLDANKADFSEPPPIKPLTIWKNKKSYKRLTNKAVNMMGNSTTKFKNNAE